MDERFDAAAFGCWPFMATLRRIPRKKIIVPIAAFFMAGDYILALFMIFSEGRCL
jgi:hypothetical protein